MARDMRVRNQMSVKEMVMLLSLAMVVGVVRGELVDLKPYHKLIVKHHNDLRRNVSPSASDMREIEWDDDLTRSAKEWAGYCRYERPPGYMYNSGANLAYQRYHVNQRQAKSVRSNVQQGLRTWSRERQFFKYGPECGMACSYAQMIYASSYRVGCAMNTCSRLRVARNHTESYSTIFMCFYAPRGKLMMSYPYHKGETCSQCPAGTYCSDGLCTEGSMMSAAALTSSESVVASLYGPAAVALAADPHNSEVAISSSLIQAQPMSTDELTNGEVRFLLQVQNMFREEAGHPELHWDEDLKKWTDWIVSCEADYPGPPHTFTNFYRSPQDMPIYEAVYEWRKEGMDANVQLQKGCRTPYDHSDCNHFTNMMQHSVMAIACSAKNCNDGTRQLVCLYDNPVGMMRQA